MIIFDNIIFSLQKAGGISVVWKNLIERVLPNYHTCQFLEYPHAIDNIQRKTLAFNQTSLIDHNYPLLIERYISPKLSYLQQPFIFHSSYYRYCTNKNAINITTVHDFTYEKFKSGITQKIHCMQKYQAILHSDAIICISRNTRDDLLHYLPYIDKNKIHVIYNGVSETYAPLNYIPYPPLREYILFIGSRENYKNFDFTVKAIKQTSFKLLICGKPLSKREKQFLDQELGPQRYLIKINISDNELNKIYNSVYCLSYPSSYEGFGIPILEAQRAGCPVIALDTSSIPEIIGDQELLMSSLSESAFYQKLDMLASNRQSIIHQGLKNSNRFSWDKMAKEYLSLYIDLLNSHHS